MEAGFERVAAALIEAKVPVFKKLVGVSGTELPFYFEHRNLSSFPDQIALVTEALAGSIRNRPVELLSDVPTGATTLTAYIQQYLRIPHIRPTLTPKKHGTGREIYGFYETGQTVGLVDDAVTTGGSFMQILRVLERNGLIVENLFAITDWDLGGKNALEEAKGGPYNLHTLVTVPQILAYGARSFTGTEQEKYLKALEEYNEMRKQRRLPTIT